MIRLMSAAVLAGTVALSMSTVAEARPYGQRDVVIVKKVGPPVCRNVTECVVKKKFFKTKRVCTTRRVCDQGHGYGHGRGHGHGHGHR